MITELTRREFDRVVLESDIPVFVCFSTTRCESCFALCLLVEDLIDEYSGLVKFVMINVEKEPELAERYNIRPLPAVLLFHHGKTVKEMGGFQYKARIRKALDTLVVKKEHSL